jgi:hypothetical protein
MQLTAAHVQSFIITTIAITPAHAPETRFDAARRRCRRPE